VLVATVPGGPRSRPMPLGTTFLLATAPFLTDKARLRRFIDNALGPAARRRRPEIAERLAAAKLAHPQSEPAWRAQVAAGMMFNPLGRQPDIDQPTLVIQGTADQVVDPGNADVLADLLPNARVELFHGAGHLLYWEQPSRALSGWCAGSSRSVEPSGCGTSAQRTGAGPTGEQDLQLTQQLPQRQADAAGFGRPSRSIVRKPWATETRVTWWCQPPKLRPSKWSSPKAPFSSR